MAAVEAGTSQGRLRSLLQRMSTTQKVAGAAAVVLLVASMLLLVVGRSSKERYAPLYTNLNMEDASRIVENLKKSKIPYRLLENGTTIEVPARVVYETRLSMASEGLPKGGGVGFEIFDKNQFGITDFTQRLNYQRALQGELARTIMELSEVEDARVHLVIPEERLYLEKQKPPTASVMLRLRPGTKLSGDQVRAIVHLVASSVEGLDPKKVTVLDTDGNLLSGEDQGEEADISRLTLTQLDAKKKFERDLESRIQSMLEGIYGPGKAIVRASADIAFDREETQSETFEPLPNGQGVVRSSKSIRERTSSQGIGGAPAGVPGTTSNIGPGEIPGVPTYQATGTSSSQSDYSEDVTNYEISRRVDRIVRTPGKIRKLSVAAFVDAELTPEQRTSLENAIVAAAGIDPARGDTVFVDGMKFDTSLADLVRAAMSSGEAAAATKKAGLLPLEYALIALAVALIALLVLLAIRRRRRAEREVPGTVIPEPLAAEPQLAAVRAEVPGTEAMDEEEAEEERIRSELERIIRNQPELVARAIEAWLEEDEEE